MATVQLGRLNPFHAIVRYRSFRLLWLASVIMQMSEWVQNITLGWLALSLTNSVAFVGQVSFMSGVPLLLLSLPAGALLDRVDRRRALVGCQIVGVVVALTVAFFVNGSHIMPWHLLVTAVLNGSLLALSVPAAQTLVPGLVERDDLTNALGLSAAGGSATRIIGPSLAGVIIGAFGIVWCFLVQGAALLAAACLSFFVHLNAPRQPAPRAEGRERFSALRVIRRDPVMIGLLLQAIAPSLLAYPVLAFFPVLARDRLGLGPAGLGALLAASGVGAVIGATGVAMLGSYQHKGRLLMIAGMLYGLVLTAFTQSSWVLLSGALVACSSGLGAIHNSLTTALLQERSPEEQRGQITSALTLSFGLTPIGALLVGQLAEHIGASNAISCGAIASSILIALTMLCFPKLRQLQ